MMSLRRPPSWVVAAFLAVAYGGCALTSKGDAQSPRYFSVEPRAAAPELPESEGAPLMLRLGQVDAAAHLEERIAYRLRGTELAYYDERRWTEAPAEYVRRALERELFERRHIRRVVSGAGATLDVELTAFEELRGPPPRVRLALSFTLHDARQSSLERSLVVERPIERASDADAMQQVAAALTVALDAAVSQLSHEVAAKIAEPAPAAPSLTEPAVPATATSVRARP
jgi:cholesterol transport system auxiliary component